MPAMLLAAPNGQVIDYEMPRSTLLPSEQVQELVRSLIMSLETVAGAKSAQRAFSETALVVTGSRAVPAVGWYELSLRAFPGSRALTSAEADVYTRFRKSRFRPI